MNIQNSFLEPEIRDGFYIPSAMKQAWAAELELLKEIDKVCKKHNIQYFADWGTLLGAVRHKGFIPWDDDLDITMKRKDFERFVEVAKSELPEGFEVFTYANHPNFWHFLSRVVAKNKICFEKEHLQKFHGFPYMVGIDIFILDYVSEDEEKEKSRVIMARYVISVADDIAEGKLTGKKAEAALNKIEELCHIKLQNRKDTHGLRVQLYRQAEKLFGAFSEKESKELTRMMPDGLYREKKFSLQKEYYDEAVWLPFENTMIPVPSAYDEMLYKRYGNYMMIIRNQAGHDYPFFEKQRKQLQSVLDFEMPGYKYPKENIVKKADNESKTWKQLLVEAQEELERYCAMLEHAVFQEENGELALNILQESQQLAIDMGTLIENCKGEGHPTVKCLEEFCEQIFVFSQEFSTEQMEELFKVLSSVKESIQHEILDRKEAVFLPYKASEWEYLESVWTAAMQDPMCDVYVIPIPYFYKDYDGSLHDMQYEAELFPENVKIIKYDEFDFGLHRPEMIFIQNPYDEYNETISVHTYFYSSNLKQYTEKLVYIPPFVLEDFTKDNHCEYFNMQYYCNVPGVVNADKVMVQSENMKQLYIEKLTEFAGEETRTIWENKIVGIGSPKQDKQSVSSKEKVILSERWKKVIKKEDGTDKKILLYYIGSSSFVQYKERMIEKMGDTFSVFYDNREEVCVLWSIQPEIKERLKQISYKLYQEYCDLEKEFLDKKLGILDDSIDEKMAVAMCDAYYGEPSHFVQMCRNAKKPVMLQNVEI